MSKKELTLADHAELWWGEQGKVVPEKNTEEWEIMYEKWINWAFEGFRKIRKSDIN